MQYIKGSVSNLFRVRIGFITDQDPDPGFYLNADPGSRELNRCGPMRIRILTRLCRDFKS
jgi:hypothetical protein